MIKVPKLEENEIFVSHVGDGEYRFNIFGSAHKNLNKFISRLADRYNIKEEYLFSFEYIEHTWSFRLTRGKISCFSIGYFIWNFYSKEWGFQELAYITIENIDPEDFPIGG